MYLRPACVPDVLGQTVEQHQCRLQLESPTRGPLPPTTALPSQTALDWADILLAAAAAVAV